MRTTIITMVTIMGIITMVTSMVMRTIITMMRMITTITLGIRTGRRRINSPVLAVGSVV